MAEIKLTLSPVKPAVWRTHPDTGAEFEIMPLPGDVDEELLGRCRNMLGQVDIHTFGQMAAPKVIRNWRGIGSNKTEEPCNPETIKRFVSAHCRSIMPWILNEARSLNHYREEEIDEAKKRLKARAAWDYQVGWAYIKGIKDAGREIDPGDLPEPLLWEAPVWDLYELVQFQWREGFNGRSGLDYGPVIRIIDHRGWDLDLTLQLLHTIENEILIRESNLARSG